MEIGSFLTVLRLLPPILVIALIVIAIFYFYRLYVVKARELSKTLSWITDIVRTMREGAPDTRKIGLAKVFKGTILEENWKELSRTLHDQYEIVEGRSRLFKHRLTVPPSHFFTPTSIIDKQLRVNYFKHLPGLLTSVGIIGTFSGLLFGLSTFDSSSPERINESVSFLLLGVRDAFYSSVFAIGAAMIVTHVEKLFYSRCLSNLDDLNDAINAMFEGGVYEEYMAILAHSASSAPRSRQPAQQASTSGPSGNVADQIEQALKPVLERLEDSQRQMAINTSKTIEKAISAANTKLASQIESALQRQVRVPLDGLGSRLSRSAASQSPQEDKDRWKKVVQEKAKPSASVGPSEDSSEVE